MISPGTLDARWLAVLRQSVQLSTSFPFLILPRYLRYPSLRIEPIPTVLRPSVACRVMALATHGSSGPQGWMVCSPRDGSRIGVTDARVRKGTGNGRWPLRVTATAAKVL